MNLLVMPAFFFSGALFPLRLLPHALYIVALVNPMTYAVDGLRGTLSNAYEFSYLMDTFVLGAMTSIAVAVGAYLFSRVEA